MKLTSRDWTEDFKYENGMYGNKCIKCGQEFIGYKRRLICKICATSKAVALKRWLYSLYWIEGKLGALIARKKRFGKLVQIGIKQKDNTYLYATADSSHWNDFKAV